MTQDPTSARRGIFAQILDYENRANPYPLYRELRRTPVAPQADGTVVVSSYRAITALMHDPRLSSDRRPDEAKARGTPAFINLDPPEHDRIRRLTMRHFGPPTSPARIDRLRPELLEIVTGLIDAFADRTRVDIVDELAYPFPVSVICSLLGVPRDDEPRFRQWTDVIVDKLDPAGNVTDDSPETMRTVEEFLGYLRQLVDRHRRQPGNDLISALATDGAGDRLTDDEIVSTSILLLIAGHETTVNLISNGVLTFLRHPGLLKRLRAEPEMIIRTVEELLRYEPSVHMITWRVALDDIPVAGSVIPKGAPVVLALAAGNRDPEYVPDPDVFDPDRQVEHLAFSGGIHYCFGAPLARLEAQIALTQFVQRLENPRLVTDPPPYRPSPVLRGPRHLLVEFDRCT
jgi:cytochrome P450